MTKPQTILIHTAKRDLQLTDEQYRTVLRSVAHVDSSKHLDNAAFEDVMAVLEAQGFRHEGKPPTYWRDKVDARTGGATAGERLAWKIRELHAKAPAGLPLHHWASAFSQGRTRSIEKLKPREASDLVEMLKDKIARAPEPAPAREPAMFQEEIPF